MRRAAVLWGLALTLALAGCGGEKTPAPTPTAEPTPVPAESPAGPLVKTDWSKLTPYEPEVQEAVEEIGSRWYEGDAGELIPRDDYGMLVPYAGERLDPANYYAAGFYYGLMTMDGKVVVDPVYTSVSVTRYGDGEKYVLPMYLLRRGAEDPETREVRNQYAVAALDGSWCTDFDYEFAIPGPDGLFLVTGDGCMVMTTDGKTVSRWTWADLGYADGEKPTWSPTPADNMPEWCDGKVTLDLVDDSFRLLDTRTGEQSQMFFEDFWALRSDRWGDDSWTVTPSGDTTVLTRENGRKELPVSCAFGVAAGNYALFRNDIREWAAYDLNGTCLVPFGTYEDLTIRHDTVTQKPYLIGESGSDSPKVYFLGENGEVLFSGNRGGNDSETGMVNGLIELVTEDAASYYRPDGTCVFRKSLAPILEED